ncbi:MAG: hypothetical protein HYY62_08110 [Deltaproteobacteria bacterium]|nr:hypothetical protein [Deltaproteobacteria bacterium]
MPKDQYDQMNEGFGSLFGSSIKSSSQDNQGSNENPLFKSPGGPSPSITFQKGPLSFSFGIGAPSSESPYDTPEGAAQRTAQIEAELEAKDKATINQLHTDWKRIHSNFTQALENLNTNLKSTSEELVNAATHIEQVNTALPSSIQKYNDALRAEDLAPPHPFIKALKTSPTSEERKSIVDLLSEIDLTRQKAGPRESSVSLFLDVAELAALEADQTYATDQKELGNLLLAIGHKLVTYTKTLLDIGISVTPLVGDARDFYELVTGQDLLTQESIGTSGQLLAGVGLLLGSGAAYRNIAAGIASASETLQQLGGRVFKKNVTETIRTGTEILESGKLYGRSKVGRTFNHHIEKGPLEEMDRKAADSFLGQKYTEIIPQPGETFYRVDSDELGSYWSRTKPTSQIQAMSENAILPDWNNFSYVHEFTVPKNFSETLYEGLSSNMSGTIRKHGEQASTFFHGGGNQVYIPKNVLNLSQFKEGIRKFKLGD